ncbi:MAG TPA: GrpB family protein [Bryobacteraceae bacterium]|nr:GrpB family protein [Bryobacteraceae bacterium]
MRGSGGGGQLPVGAGSLPGDGNLTAGILIVDYDPQWPELFEREAERVQTALGSRALRIEHAGSTSVAGLAAKPVIDVVLAVADSANEDAYVPWLESAGYRLRVREPNWYEHRMFKGPERETNLHVFSAGCPEIDRMMAFRDWLRRNAQDRELYARTKIALAQQEWNDVQAYADAKTAVIEEILTRARRF